MKICSRCVLPETFPGIRFNNEGVCNYCLQTSTDFGSDAKKKKLLAQFEKQVEQIRPQEGFQCILAFSGGKDSTFTLKLLKERYNLRILAVTLDNGFTSPQALENIRNAVEKLDVDHLWVRPRLALMRKLCAGLNENHLLSMSEITRASNTCYACIGLVKGVVLRVALEHRVSLIAYGWSPGQAPIQASFIHMSPAFIKQMIRKASMPLYTIAGHEMNPYMPQEDRLNSLDYEICNINPMAFIPYDESSILEQIRHLDWIAPTDTDGNSTNCLLNVYGIRRHIAEYGFHPYATEIANLVRNNYLGRDEGLAKLNDIGSESLAEEVKKKLNIPA